MEKRGSLLEGGVGVGVKESFKRGKGEVDTVVNVPENDHNWFYHVDRVRCWAPPSYEFPNSNNP